MDKKSILNAIFEIAEDIDGYFQKYSTYAKHKVSVSSGFTGVALFYGYLAKHSGNNKYYDKCEQIMEFCIDHLNTSHEPSLYGGHTGVAWTIRNLVNLGAFDKSSLEILSDIDPVIEKSSGIFIKSQFYSLMYGLIGQGVYYLEMISNANLSNEAVDPFENLRKIVRALDHFSVNQDDTLTWIDHISTEDKNSKNPIYNLGIPHGVSGILCFLSIMHEMDIEKERAENLLRQGVKWLLKQKNNFYDISYYPSLIGAEYLPHLTRLGWSYGDLCVALALLRTSQVLKDKSLEEQALDTALISTKRNLKTAILYTKKENNFNYLDVGLCKGTAGIIMLYERFYDHFRDEALKKAQGFWLNLTFEYKNPAGGIAGYKAHISNDGEETHWTEDVAFLDGASGVGLSFISLINPGLKQWQRLLLL